MSNVIELKRFLADKAPGTKLELATSQYASNTTAPGHKFDFHTTAQAVRSLIDQGWLKGQCGWRYYDVEVLPRKLASLTDKKFQKAYDMAQAAREALYDASDNPDFTQIEGDRIGQLGDDIARACDSFDIS